MSFFFARSADRCCRRQSMPALFCSTSSLLWLLLALRLSAFSDTRCRTHPRLQDHSTPFARRRERAVIVFHMCPCSVRSLVSTCLSRARWVAPLAQSSLQTLECVCVCSQGSTFHSMGAQEFGGRQGETLQPIMQSHMPLDTLEARTRPCPVDRHCTSDAP